MHLTFGNSALLIGAGFLAGIMNAVAGGGTFLTFPALVFIGMPSVAANQTSTFAVFPGQVASFWAFRKILAAEKRTVVVLGLTSLFGGSMGAIILLSTSSAAFDSLAPWLLLFATLIYSFGNTVRKRLGWRLIDKSDPEIGWKTLLKAALIQLLI